MDGVLNKLREGAEVLLKFNQRGILTNGGGGDRKPLNQKIH